MYKEEAKAKFAASMAKVKPKFDAASARARAAMAEIKANFKADEGVTGFKKFLSMFVNLWKSGSTGKGAMIAPTVVVLLLVWTFSGDAGKVESLLRERNDLANELCEMKSLLGEKLTEEPTSIDEMPDVQGVLSTHIGFQWPSELECDIEKNIKDYKNSSSDERKLGRAMLEAIVKELKNANEETRAQCIRKGISYNGSSPFGMAKKFLFNLREGKVIRASLCVENGNKGLFAFLGYLLSFHDIFLPESLKVVKNRMQKTEYHIVAVETRSDGYNVEVKVNGEDRYYNLTLKKEDEDWRVVIEESSILEYFYEGALGG